MRRFIIGGNWKMNLGTPEETRVLLEELVSLTRTINNVEIVVFPPFTTLYLAKELTEGSNIKVGAQNMYFEMSGAYTGEISPKFIKSLGCDHVILGHSERRNIFHESDKLINKKLKKALQMGLTPIVCIGEHLEERESGKTDEVIQYQLENTFKGLSREEMLKTVIAYEPIWAIGTGKTATPEQAEAVHEFIREILSRKYDESLAQAIRIQYGGSINPTNAFDLFKEKNIDGGLVGGASLKAESFNEIIKAAERIFNLN
ncbi:MAG: triose-phosphate isomerase [Promethearchaeota archaeon]